jgi:hypothetical protein
LSSRGINFWKASLVQISKPTMTQQFLCSATLLPNMRSKACSEAFGKCLMHVEFVIVGCVEQKTWCAANKHCK